MLFEQRIQTVKLSPNEQRIADFIIEQKENIAHLTTRDIAKCTYTSSSTVVRLSQKLHYNGFEDLKKDYLQELQYLQAHFQDIDPNFPFHAHHTIMDIAALHTILMKETADDTQSLIHHDSLQKAVQLLWRAKQIYLYGIENNQALLTLFKYNMIRINRPVILETQYGNQVYSALQSSAQDCAIVVSYSGESRDLVSITQHLYNQGCPIITITSMGENSISRLSSCPLYLSTREKLSSKIAPFSIEYSILLILNILYSAVFAKNYNQNIELKINRTRQLETSRYSTSTILQEDDETLTDKKK